MRRKKDNGFKAIVCLAVATIAVGAASIAVSKMDNMENTPNAVVTPLPQGSEEAAGTTSLDIAGASAKIKKYLEESLRISFLPPSHFGKNGLIKEAKADTNRAKLKHITSAWRKTFLASPSLLEPTSCAI